jgi:hypothetical protein
MIKLTKRQFCQVAIPGLFVYIFLQLLSPLKSKKPKEETQIASKDFRSNKLLLA